MSRWQSKDRTEKTFKALILSNPKLTLLVLFCIEWAWFFVWKYYAPFEPQHRFHLEQSLIDSFALSLSIVLTMVLAIKFVLRRIANYRSTHQ